MKSSQKSPKATRLRRKIVPYVIFFGSVIAIFSIGFLAGYLTASGEAITTASTVEVDKPVESDIGWIEFTATAYCPCEECCGEWARLRPSDENGERIIYGATGIILEEGVSIAADTTLYPMGTQFEIAGMGTYTVQDRGGAIVGNKIDIYFESHEEAKEFGVQTVYLREVK